MFLGGPNFSASTQAIIDFARSMHIPSMYYRSEFVKAGGLIAYGPNVPDMFRRSASFVARILQGARAADLPVERPTRFDYAINLATANSFGLDVPPEILAEATEIIR